MSIENSKDEEYIDKLKKANQKAKEVLLILKKINDTLK